MRIHDHITHRNFGFKGRLWAFLLQPAQVTATSKNKIRDLDMKTFRIICVVQIQIRPIYFSVGKQEV